MLLARLVKGRTWRAMALDSCFDIVAYVLWLLLGKELKGWYGMQEPLFVAKSSPCDGGRETKCGEGKGKSMNGWE